MTCSFGTVVTEFGALCCNYEEYQLEPIGGPTAYHEVCRSMPESQHGLLIGIIMVVLIARFRGRKSI